LIPLDPYQKRLVAFLSVATFFEGYDFFAIAQILPTLRAELHLDPSAAGVLLAVVNFGTVLASGLVRLADRWGRRRVLSITIVGYTLCSALTAAATDAWTFGAAQLLARVFLIGEWAVAMVIAAEELPADRRGTMIGIIQASSSLGGIACAAAVPALLGTSLGWRSVYLIGTVPLVLAALARRGLRETRRFAERAPDDGAPRGVLAVLRGPYRRRVLELGLIWSLTYVCTQSATTFWKEFAVGERGLSDAQVGLSLSVAAVAAMPLVFGAGKLFDRLGRRSGGAIVFVAASAGVLGAYTLSGQWPLTAALVVAVFGTSAVLPLLNAYTAELFPTAMRADAFALANNVLGRVGYVLAPAFVGAAAASQGFGRAVGATALFPIVALALVLLLLPETRGRELEDTARVG
jgi:putative MFS transporter